MNIDFSIDRQVAMEQQHKRCVAILTFHSGEDRLVKKAFKRYYKEGIFSGISQDVIRPSAEECRANGRARSTKLRWAVK